jgi:16S rRNA (cytosine967-C5)-methyltransferase
MTPAARLQAAVELVDQIVAAARDAGAAADTLIAGYFRTRRYAGSKDRRAVRDLVYDAVRLCGERPPSGRAAMLALARTRPELLDLFDGSPHGPAPVAADEPVAAPGLVPAWLAPELAHVDLPALLGRAPLDLRVNTLRLDREAARARLPGAVPTRHAPHGLRLADPVPIERDPLFVEGAVEVQDEGSQLIAIACRAAPGMTVVDLCAGAGGKTLALAAEMAGAGRLVACDTDRTRLGRLPGRADRAGARGIEQRLLDPGRETDNLADLAGTADVVLIDAPCSGTGTWRRNPEARWRLTPARLDRLVALQARLLGLGASLVRPGGALVYAVCSLLDREGAAQVDAFLAAHPGWQCRTPFQGVGEPRGQGVLLSPYRDGTDGFFVARLESPC